MITFPYISGLLLAAAVLLGGCGGPVSDSIVSDISHPFIGCWESEDGLARESWTLDPSGWLFGYAVNRNEAGEVTFFEQMRLETGDGIETLIVSGPNEAPVSFERDKAGDLDEYRFINPEHDYPQVISYMPVAGRLDAEINTMDGSNSVKFEKRKCRE